VEPVRLPGFLFELIQARLGAFDERARAAFGPGETYRPGVDRARTVPGYHLAARHGAWTAAKRSRTLSRRPRISSAAIGVNRVIFSVRPATGRESERPDQSSRQTISVYLGRKVLNALARSGRFAVALDMPLSAKIRLHPCL
jgi:hypothetical protein